MMFYHEVRKHLVFGDVAFDRIVHQEKEVTWTLHHTPLKMYAITGHVVHRFYVTIDLNFLEHSFKLNQIIVESTAESSNAERIADKFTDIVCNPWPFLVHCSQINAICDYIAYKVSEMNYFDELLELTMKIRRATDYTYWSLWGGLLSHGAAKFNREKEFLQILTNIEFAQKIA